MIPETIPAKLRELTFGQLIDHMMKNGFSKEHYKGRRGRWTDGELRAKEHSTVFGVAYSTFQKAHKDGGHLHSTTIDAIANYFFRAIECEDHWNDWHDLAFDCYQNSISKENLPADHSQQPLKTSLWANWSECVRQPTHPVRHQLHNHIETCENRVFLITSINPEGFSQLLPLIETAVKSGRADVYWAYHLRSTWAHCSNDDDSGCSNPLSSVELQRFSMVPWRSSARGRPDEFEDRSAYEKLLLTARDECHRLRVDQSQSKVGQFVVLESRIFHYSMSFVSLPKVNTASVSLENLEAVCELKDIFGFAQLYIHFPREYSDRPALFFEGDDDVSLMYASSALKFFGTGQKIPYWDEQYQEQFVEALRISSI